MFWKIVYSSCEKNQELHLSVPKSLLVYQTINSFYLLWCKQCYMGYYCIHTAEKLTLKKIDLSIKGQKGPSDLQPLLDRCVGGNIWNTIINGYTLFHLYCIFSFSSFFFLCSAYGLFMPLLYSVSRSYYLVTSGPLVNILNCFSLSLLQACPPKL